jgi:TIR domain
MPDDTPAPRDPMRLYVCWHPDSPAGAAFAPALFNWFRGDPGNLLETGFGIPVRYRCTSDPKPIPLDEADLSVIVPLVDEHMVVSGRWREFFEKGAFKDRRVALYPVALHSSAYQLPGNVSRLNFLRVGRATDPGTWSGEERRAVERQRLISLLTQACCRLLWARQTGVGTEPDRPGQQVKVFISHAKADGVDIAEAIRLQIFRQGQMQAFFDESDLAIGYAFEGELASQAGATSTAMIAVNTDAYASRPWCQREIRLAREPKPVSVDGRERQNCWRSIPLLVVDALAARPTRYLAEFGYATVVRWQAHTITEIIDHFLREMLIGAHNEERAKRVPVAEGRHSLNGLADLYAAMAIRAKTENSLEELVVPSPGYPRPDRKILESLLSSIRLRTFDEVEAG